MPGEPDEGRASDALKMAAAEELGIADKIRQEGWENVTTREVGLVVRNMIKLGEEALMAKEEEHGPEGLQ